MSDCQSCEQKDEQITSLISLLERTVKRLEESEKQSRLHPCETVIGKDCNPGGGGSLNPPAVSGGVWPLVTNNTWDKSKCGCRPENGGSGICGCVLNSWTIC